MVGAVDQLRLDVDHWIAREDAAFQRLAHSLFRRLDEFTRNHAADDLVLEDETFALLRRLDVDDHMAVLTLTTGLANELAFYLFNAFSDRLSISHLRTA